jgi:hypothetical protein
MMYLSADFHYLTLVRLPAVGIVSNATVSINVTSPPPFRSFFYRASSAYNSGTVTYNTRPPVFDLLYSQRHTASGVITFDVTQAVNAAFPEPLTLQLQMGGYGYGPKSSINMVYTLASQQPPTPMPTPTAEPTVTPSPTATPSASAHRLDLPSGGVADVTAVATFGEIMVAGLLVFLIGAVLFALAYAASRKGVV